MEAVKRLRSLDLDGMPGGRQRGAESGRVVLDTRALERGEAVGDQADLHGGA